jgi:hypothetical protein
MYQNETTSFLKDCAEATIRLNDQTQAAFIMQLCADEGKYDSVEDLTKHAAYLGASYKVLAWLDSYCLTRNLYNNQ